MITEIQKLQCLRRFTLEKLHEHEVYSSNQFLALWVRKHFAKQVKIERAILSDINKRLVHLGCNL